MKKKIHALLGINLLLLLLTLGDFLALHDIQNDYISAEILTSLGITTSATLPGWTATTGEWAVVAFSFWGRLLLLGIAIVLLWQLIKTQAASVPPT